ncbi:MAG TPA: isocitrate lyase/PEP mutase family protein [Hyphomicrobiaceae bacterium]|nr:isocitrate lyase/PEP mutase family protein [Hyphomicrobiaceae bacterium]
MASAPTLKSMIQSGPLVVAPGAYDSLTAKLVEQAGFPAVYMTGAGTSVSHGLPDYGLLTMTEMVANAGRMAGSIGVPLVSDADNGYGNELNVFRTVQAFERAGVQAIHIEDQVFPKRCGHLDGKELVTREDYAAKIRAAAAARRTSDFLIIARTDARGVAGFDEAIARCNLALEAGADMAFFEAPQSVEEVAAVPKAVKGPCLFNNVLSGKTPSIPHAEIDRMGYRLAIVPGMLMSSIIGLCDKLLAELKSTGLVAATYSGGGPGVTFGRVGAAEWDARRTAFRDDAASHPGRDAAE